MWPKMLFDLLPHFARLMPMADKYLSTRSASDKAQEAALAALALDLRADLRTELGKSGDSQAGLLRQMQEQTAQIGDLALDVARTRLSVEGAETRLTRLEGTVVALEAKSAEARKLLRIVLVLMVLALGLLTILVFRQAH
jgi:septal ring factor EnvC (AmiA/AmiB activator)